ncbi:MAG: hypothetical protein A4E23_01413 [Methanomethylovorans sp. PtaU1.Bin073]|nr:MAG: hypothetical protein A4E23_01413 [Methanomethylovorans sp. PtaU1.Bin073]
MLLSIGSINNFLLSTLSRKAECPNQVRLSFSLFILFQSMAETGIGTVGLRALASEVDSSLVDEEYEEFIANSV